MHHKALWPLTKSANRRFGGYPLRRLLSTDSTIGVLQRWRWASYPRRERILQNLLGGFPMTATCETMSRSRAPSIRSSMTTARKRSSWLTASSVVLTRKGPTTQADRNARTAGSGQRETAGRVTFCSSNGVRDGTEGIGARSAGIRVTRAGETVGYQRASPDAAASLSRRRPRGWALTFGINNTHEQP